MIEVRPSRSLRSRFYQMSLEGTAAGGLVVAGGVRKPTFPLKAVVNLFSD